MNLPTYACASCGHLPRREGRVTCARCAASTAAYRKRLVAAGLCVTCREPRNGPYQCCARCREIKSIKGVARRDERRAAGICFNCSAPATRGVYCDAHHADTRARDRAKRTNPGPVRPVTCGHCGGRDHFARTCPQRRTRAA